MITYFHHPKCSKSCKGLSLLLQNNIPFSIHHYLENPPKKKILHHIINQYKGNPIDLIRDPQSIKTHNTHTIISHLYNHPETMQRPLLVHNNNIILGRPVDNIIQFINDYLT